MCVSLHVRGRKCARGHARLHVCVHMCGSQRTTCGSSFLLLREFQGINSGHLGFQQEPLSTKSSTGLFLVYREQLGGGGLQLIGVGEGADEHCLPHTWTDCAFTICYSLYMLPLLIKATQTKHRKMGFPTLIWKIACVEKE